MQRNAMLRATLNGLFALALLAVAAPSQAGFGDALKKMKEQSGKKSKEAIDKAVQVVETPDTKKDSTAAAPAPATATAAPAAAATSSDASATKVAAVSTKFDFVPGDKVILADDFTQDELGEFPVRWKAIWGNFEVAESGGERWLRCMSPDGTVRLRLPEAPALPEYWTLEFDFYGTAPMEGAMSVKGMTKDDRTVWEATWPANVGVSFRSGEFYSTTPLAGATGPDGRHHFMLMARKNSLKVYMDRERMVNAPELATTMGVVMALDIRLWANTQPMITNVRYAEGCKPAQDLLATGKLVTYGIHFATGSDVVLADSAPILRQVAAWLQANPQAKLSIVGHTDNVGGAASNLDLSKRRAASVARVLSEQFSIAADRLTPGGRGDTQAVASNDKPEGRAMNRRVEFAKL
jgi:outer membrane protein OmpA-like peptidoglycan-associated protein